MERDGAHELAAAYALNALDEHEEREYEDHLRRCSHCRKELVWLQETAAALAYGAEPAQAPPALRDRVLRAVQGEQPSNVVPLRARWALRAAVGIAAVAASAAVGLGLWATSLSSSLDQERSALDRQTEAIAILSDPGANERSLSGARGRVVVSGDQAALVISNVEPAPEGRAYAIWVMIESERPQAAGLFRAADGTEVVRLTRPVRPGATVVVTLERAGGVDAPSEPPRFSAKI